MAGNQSENITIVGEVDDYQEIGKPDITFVFPKDDGKVILTQKALLAEQSETFKVQFESPLNGGDVCNRIIIEDISFDNFKTMINFLYEDDENKNKLITRANCLDLMYASHKYFLHDLTNSVIKVLKNTISSVNVVSYYRSIEKYNIKILNDYILRNCIMYPESIIGQLKKTKEDLRLLKMLLKSPKINCTEFKLHNAVWQMFKREYKGKKYTDQAFRKDVGKLKYLIRFPVMTLAEIFECGNKKPSLLTTQEIIDFQSWCQEKTITTTIQAYSVEFRMEYTCDATKGRTQKWQEKN